MQNQQMGLFQPNETLPLAHRVRPGSIADFAGQEHLQRRIQSIDFDHPPHIILYGPPGCGKTTLAKILAQQAECELYEFNAVLGGVNDLRKIIQTALQVKETGGRQPMIFIDEIHRFNKGQQDALLPYLEAGDFTLLGATTENPNTSLNKAILSRVQRWPLHALAERDLAKIIERVLTQEQLLIPSEVKKYLVKHANGDARVVLNQLEGLILNKDQLQDLSFNDIKTQFLFENRRYDKDSERHYDVISAFIKSIRGSDVNAAILWLAVMLDGGEDIEFIARRLIILASEDIGNADPRALQIATDAHYGIKQIGMPEARIILAQATTYLARAPKSNASYKAIDEALAYVKENPTIEVPTHLRNHHPDKKNYQYPHQFPHHWVKQQYAPKTPAFFSSSELGYEKMQDDYERKTQS